MPARDKPSVSEQSGRVPRGEDARESAVSIRLDTERLSTIDADDVQEAFEQFETLLAALGANLDGIPAGTYVQTFSTADRTHAARTSSAVVTTAATDTTPFGYSEAQANAIVAAVNAVRADLADTAALLNALIDDLQTLGLIG